MFKAKDTITLLFFNQNFFSYDEGKTWVCIVFSYGPYDFIGKRFAMIVMRVALARLLLAFTFSLDPGNEINWRFVCGVVQPEPAIIICVRNIQK